MASGISRLGGDALLRKTFKKYATSLATVSNKNKKKYGRGEACALYISRHYDVDAGYTVCGQTGADNARWKRINSSASGLLKQEFGGDQPASGRSHVAASLCSKVTVVAKRLLISEVSHPVLLPRRRLGLRQLQFQTISKGAVQPWECITSSMQFPPSII